jgi:uncharacterized protein
VRGIVGGPSRPHRSVDLVADDGTALAASLIDPPRVGAPSAVLAHGFAARADKPAYARLADGLAARFGVLSLDLRGHGGSAGQCTFGDDEALDVEAAVRWLRENSGGPVVLVGVSMGGTAVLHALARGLDVEAAALISTPAFFGRTSTPPLAQLDDLWRSGWKRRALAVATGVRLRGPEHWNGLEHPVDLAARTDVPLLVVHGEDDHFFPPSDAEALVGAAGGPTTLWHEQVGFGHAEDGLTPSFSRQVGRALEIAVIDGRVPDRRPSGPALRSPGGLPQSTR